MLKSKCFIHAVEVRLHELSGQPDTSACGSLHWSYIQQRKTDGKSSEKVEVQTSLVIFAASFNHVKQKNWISDLCHFNATNPHNKTIALCKHSNSTSIPSKLTG